MSTGIDVVRTERPENTDRDDRDDGAPTAGVVDVSEVSASRLREFADGTAGSADVHIEHRGGRTFLVSE